jgi:hypothetical protein
MGCLSHVNVKIEVSQYSTPCRGNTNNCFLKVHLIDDLSDDSMQEAVAAPRAIVERGFLDGFRS